MGAQDKKGHNARYLAYSMHNVRTVTLLDNATYMYRPMSGEGGGGGGGSWKRREVSRGREGDEHGVGGGR